MPTQLQKLEAHASHLLDEFIRLKEKYALLEPMLFDPEMTGRFSSGRRAHGFTLLRTTLFLSCAQDIAKLSFDNDARAPSISNLVKAIEDPGVQVTLRERFAEWRVPPTEDFTDPEVIAALRHLELREQQERCVQFEDIFAKARDASDELAGSDFSQGFRTIRDKVTAHTEIRYVADTYQPVDIATLGIQWRDLKRAIDLMQVLVDALGQLIRNAGFAWDYFDEQLTELRNNYWTPQEGAEPGRNG